MPAPKNNQFWKARTTHGREKLFSTPEILKEACEEYFQWIDDNPLQASELIKFQGKAKIKELPKMRAMTLDGLHIFLETNSTTWSRYREYKDFSEVVTQVEKIIRTQKFQGAAAEMLNSNIIARELGLTDKSERTNKTSLTDASDEELNNRIKSLLEEEANE
jgi:hypothetical protein